MFPVSWLILLWQNSSNISLTGIVEHSKTFHYSKVIFINYTATVKSSRFFPGCHHILGLALILSHIFQTTLEIWLYLSNMRSSNPIFDPFRGHSYYNNQASLNTGWELRHTIWVFLLLAAQGTQNSLPFYTWNLIVTYH